MSVPMALEDDQPVSRAAQVAALLVLAASVALLRLLRFQHVIALTQRVCQAPRRAATTEEAERAVMAVRSAARLWPGRAACLETSIASAWLTALRGRGVTWCHGVRPNPYAFHAWIQTDGRPVAEPPTTSSYLLTIAIPPIPERTPA